MTVYDQFERGNEPRSNGKSNTCCYVNIFLLNLNYSSTGRTSLTLFFELLIDTRNRFLGLGDRHASLENIDNFSIFFIIIHTGLLVAKIKSCIPRAL